MRPPTTPDVKETETLIDRKYLGEGGDEDRFSKGSIEKEGACCRNGFRRAPTRENNPRTKDAKEKRVGLVERRGKEGGGL